MKFRSLKLRLWIFALLSTAATQVIHAQTHRIMPVGNSITLGKVNSSRPIPPDEGYRSRLNAKLTSAGVNFVFVGDSGTTANAGHFADGARIGMFLPDSSMDITDELAQHSPEVVILEIGTNNIGINLPIGNFTTSGTMINQYYTLVKAIVDNPTVQHLLLTKIIPPVNSPAKYDETRNFNDAIEIMLTESDLAGNTKITLIDMFTPFDAKKDTWYNSGDNIHPNLSGYEGMAEIFFRYLQTIFVQNITDYFNRAAGSPGANWTASTGIQIVDVGESGGGGAIMMNAVDADWATKEWDNLAIYNTSRGYSTVGMRFHPTATAADLNYVGLALALDTNAVAIANGYMIFVLNSSARLFPITNGAVDLAIGQLDQEAITPLQPGDSIQVSYKPGSDANVFSFSVNNGTAVSLADVNKRRGNGSTMYSGVMFRGNAAVPLYSQPIDWFRVNSQLPDNVVPGAPYNFNYVNTTNTSVLLVWNAPGSDGYGGGVASSYDLRFSTQHITESSFVNASIVSGLNPPAAPGSAEQYSVSGLIPGTRYYFRVRAVDNWGNKGDLSEEISVSTNASGTMLEQFNRSVLGDDWVTYPDEYQTDWVASGSDTIGEFSSHLGGGAWNHAAIFTGRTNPSVVKLVWGDTATTAGIRQGGLALMLTAPDMTASGYMLWIMNYPDGTRLVRLYNIQNGQPGSDEIDEAPYILTQFPKAGDTLAVALDWRKETANTFDVFINGAKAAGRTLYDPLRRYRTDPMYSGIILAGMGRQNNVSRFITISEYVGPGPLEKYSGDNASGVVGTTLSSPLQILYRDANNTPLPGMPVWFWVTEPSDATVDSPPRMFNPIQIETEWDKSPLGTYIQVSDAAASGGKYMVAETGTGSLTYDFYVEKDTSYYLWGRTITTDFRHMAVEIKIDDQYDWVWNANNPNFSSQWQWGTVKHQNQPVTSIRLAKGLHTLQVLKAHDNVKIDKFMVTWDETPHFTGTNLIDTRVTDQNGIAGAILTLGKTAGPNKVSARPFGTSQSVEFIVTGLPAAPASMTKLNDNQTGAARDTLDFPFTVTLFDSNQNKVPNIEVKFEVVKGKEDGGLSGENYRPASSVITLTDTTNANGQASAYLVFGMGASDSIYTVKASLPGYPAVPTMLFTGTIASGRVKKIVLVDAYGVELQSQAPLQFPNTPRAAVGDSLIDFFRVKVTDDQQTPQPLNNIAVVFRVTTGDARVSPPVFTDTLGIAKCSLWFGSSAGIVTVTAQAGAITKTAATDSVFYKAIRIEKWSGDEQRAFIRDTLNAPVKVKVFDAFGVGLANHPVTFTVKNRSGSGFRIFSNGLDTITVRSNSSGFASTNVRVDSIHGYYSNIVEATSNDGFSAITGSPLYFSQYVISTASKLILVQGNGQEGVVRGRLLQPLIVQIVDANNNPVKFQPVVFKRLSSTGLFDGTLADSLVELTGANGMAEVVYYLGSSSGTGSDTVRVSATRGDRFGLFGSPVEFVLSARSTGAQSISVYPDTSALRRTGTAGKALADPVYVIVKDEHGNPVIGEAVTFKVTDGGGSLDGTGRTTVVDTVDNALGVAEARWFLGTHAGTATNKLEVSADNGIVSLTGSPVRFTASVVADSVSSSRSRIEATGPTKATGVDTCWITITLLDKYDNPVSGKQIGLTIKGRKVGGLEQNFYPQEIGPTDASGQAKGYLVSTVSGEKSISAIDVTDHVPLDAQTKTTFLSNNAAEIEIPNGSTNQFNGNIGTVLTDSLVIKIVDVNGNPVVSSARFSVTRGGGRIIESQPVVSDTNGLAWVHLILGPNAGENTVQATAFGSTGAALKGSPLTFTATGQTALAKSMYSVPSYAQTQNGQAGVELPQPFVVGVLDLNGRPVFNIPIQFAVESGNASLISSSPIMTDAYGYAYAWVRAGTTVGASVIKGFNNSLSNSPQSFTVNTTAGPARDLQYVSGNNQAGHVGQALPNPLKVMTVDAYGNPKSGISVQFSVVSGDATIGGQSTVTALPTNAAGITQIIVTMGQNGGPVRVEASHPELGGSPVVFNLTFSPLEPADIVKVRGDNQKVAVNHNLVDPISVRVVDQHGIAVPGYSVLFTLESGGGQLIGSGSNPIEKTAYSNAQGIASIQYQAGAATGTIKVRAIWLTKTLDFTLEAVQDYHFPVLDKALLANSFTYVDSGYVIDEGNVLGQSPNLIYLAATDADNDLLEFQVFQLDSLAAPTGAEVYPQSVATALFHWEPDFDQAGNYFLVFRVVDGKGGYDADTVLVKVMNTNRPPVINNATPPADSMAYTGSLIRFYVEATDKDRDVLHYHWKVGSVDQSGDAPVFEYVFPKNDTGNRTVSVVVDDGMASTQTSWKMTVITAVEMSLFNAVFNTETRRMEIEWETSREVGNLGFDIYRGLSENGEFTKVNAEFIASEESGRYRFEDDSVRVGKTYYYKIMDLDADGSRQTYGPLLASVPLPKQFEMSQNYPNPFNPNTVIRYAVPKSERVVLSIFNLMGQEVARLVDKTQEPGFYTVSWNGLDQNGREAATGIYLYRLRGERQTVTLRMVKMQ